MDTLLQDIRYGIRMVAKSPGFAAIAILTLALGIGADTALFSVVNGVLLNPLPYRQPDRLVAIYARSKEFSHGSISYPNFLDWVRSQRSFSSLAAFRQDDFNLTGMGEPERVRAEMVSADFFSVLGVNPVAGRLLRPEEDQVGAQPVALVSGGFGQRKFGSSAEAVGKTLRLDGVGYTVVGVIPADFRYQSGNFHNSRRVRAYRPVERSDLSRPAREHGHGRGGPAQAGSDASSKPRRTWMAWRKVSPRHIRMPTRAEESHWFRSSRTWWAVSGHFSWCCWPRWDSFS